MTAPEKRRSGEEAGALPGPGEPGPGRMTGRIAISHSDHLLRPAGQEPGEMLPEYRTRGLTA